MRKVTLCLLIGDNNRVLLAMKKRGFGAGKWNGVGGKVAEGEAIEDTAVRETREEISASIDKKDLEQVADIEFTFDGKSEWNQEMIVYKVRKWQGEPVESEEMMPKWFDAKTIPYESMWPDDIYWLPKVLAGGKIKGEFLFNSEGNIIGDNWKVEEVSFF